MPIDPHTNVNKGTIGGVNSVLGDIQRRLAGVEARTGRLAPNAIIGDHLSDGSVGNEQIASGAITAGSIAAGSITAEHITAGAITANAISANAINANHIQANAINAGHIQADSITSAHIVAGTITAGDIAAGTITATQIAAGTITATQIAASTITAAQIAAGTITATQIAAATITGSLIAGGTITATNIAAATITGSLIAATTITGDKLVAGTITATQIAAETITAAKIAANTITAAKIAANTITAAEIAAGAIQTDELAADAVTAAKIAALAVTTGKLDAGAVTAAKIAANTITAAQIAATTITAAEIAADAITTAKIAAGAVTAAKIAANTITAAQIAANTITAAQIAANTITAAQIAADTITAAQIAADTITAAEIAADAITTAKIAAGAVTAAKIAANTITASQIAAGTITSAQIASGTITATNIASGTITATQIAAGTITGALIASATITGDRLVSGTVTATQIGVSQLSAISANMGTITAGTITGATFQSSAANPRVVMDSTGVYALDSAGNTTFRADSVTGKIITLAGIGGGNRLYNSSMKYGSTVDGWSMNNAGGTVATLARSGEQFKHGSFSAKLNVSTGGTVLGLQNTVAVSIQAVNLDYVGSIWVRPSRASTAQMRLQCRDSTGAVTSTISGATTNVPANTWTRIIAAGQLPSGTESMTVIGRYDNPNAGDVVYFDAAQLEEGLIPTSYAPKPDEILPESVTNTEIQPNTITGDRLVIDAITAREIAANTITSVQIAANTITAGQIASGTITATQIASGTITAGQIATGTITSALIAADQITTTHLDVNAVIAENISSNAVTTAKLNAEAVTAAKIATNTITATQIAANTITAAQIAASTITATQIASATITSGQIAAATITGGNIASNTITATQIAAGTITAAEIAAGAITASKINVQFGGGNILTNSSGRNGTTDWQAAGSGVTFSSVTGASVSIVPFYGLNVFRVTRSGSTGVAAMNNQAVAMRKPVVGGLWYTASAYFQKAAAATARQTRIVIRYFDSTDTQITAVSGSFFTEVGATWVRATHTAQAPSNAVKANMEAQVHDVPVNEEHFIDGLQFEAGEVASSFAPKVDEILPNEVSGTMIQGGAITTSHMTAGTINGDRISANTITATQIAANTITASQIASNTITATQIASNTITATQIAADTITAAQIAASAVTASEIASLAVTTAKLDAAAVTSAKVAAGAITADKITVASLSAITADAGLITAGTFRGPIFETAVSPPKVRMDATGLFVESSAGVKPVKVTAAGGIDFLTAEEAVSDERTLRWLTSPSSELSAVLSSTRKVGVSVDGALTAYGVSGTVPATQTLGAQALGGALARVIARSEAPTTSGPTSAARSPGTGASAATIGDQGSGNAAWASPGNILTSDNVRSIATLTGTQDTTQWLKATNFGFSIPSNAVIRGIIVSVERQAGAASRIADNSIRLVKADKLTGADKSSQTAWPTTEAAQTYGTSTDLWSSTWQPADFNASNFGVALRASLSSAGADVEARVDHVQVTVHYEISSANPGRVVAQVGSATERVLLNQSDQSDFVRLGGSAPGKRLLNGGSFPTAFSNANTLNAFDIEHGLGVTPVSVVAISDTHGIGARAYGLNASNFDIGMYTTDGSLFTGAVTIYWMAFG